MKVDTISMAEFWNLTDAKVPVTHLKDYMKALMKRWKDILK